MVKLSGIVKKENQTFLGADLVYKKTTSPREGRELSLFEMLLKIYCTYQKNKQK